MKVIRSQLTGEVLAALGRSRSVAIIGPRQSGKTTLALQLAREANATYFDLEDPTSAARLEDPKLALENLSGLVVIDEVQRRPDLLPVLRVLLDRDPLPARFLLLGSASPDLIRGASESLAGRIEFTEVGGFDVREIPPDGHRRLWLRGGFPLSYLAGSDHDSIKWRLGFVQTFLERDLRLLGHDMPPVAMRRFLTMVAHYSGQTWNSSDVARSLQVAHTTARRYLDLMTGALVVRQLPPWFENVGKRLVKAPKVYLRDTGILHGLLGIETWGELEGHPKLGASWEGFALENLLRVVEPRFAYFWATHGGAELDLLIVKGSGRVGLEFKYTSAPATTRSMRSAMHDLRLDRLYVVHPGTDEFPLDERITAIGLPAAVDRLSS